MATNNKRIQVGELDFDAIKTNLKNFLKGQTEFQDYDFEGSGLAVLLDVLAYNTHYNSIYTNLAINETFLDSASKRSSVVSLAKMLGYTPRSAKCAEAIVNVVVNFPTSNPEVVTLPANQPFTTSVDNVTYTFYNRGAQTVTRSASGAYVFNNVVITEGTPLQFKYTVSDGTRFIIPNANVDLDSLNVLVQETADSDLFEVYVKETNITNVRAESKIYFVKEIDDGLYELTFGNDILGKALSQGNVVTIQYTISSLERPNSASTFTYDGATLSGGIVSVITVAPASGGSVPESISEIKFNAPKFYSAQNRTVTAEDYKSIIYANYARAQTVAVWGGEDNKPPVYGKTFICIKPKDAPRLTNLEKQSIISDILTSRSILSITPELVDPSIFNIRVSSFVYYNPRATTKTPQEIETLVKQSILDYDRQDLQKFDSVLRHSKLTRIIDNTDQSIINNTTRLTITNQQQVFYNISAQYDLELINPILKSDGRVGEESFITTGFYIQNSNNIHFLDDFNGSVRLFYYDVNSQKVIVNPSIGTINYDSGRIIVKNLNIRALAGQVFEWIIKPQSYDVVSALNQIVQIDPENLVVNVIADNTINGDTQAGYNYQFTSIRE
jgi:hypothetical protein